MNNKTLILGLGNDILTDDGIGPKIVLDLQKELPWEQYDFLNVCVGGLELLDYMQHYNKVVIVDAIKTENGKPGDVYLFTVSDFHETSHISNLHDINFITALQLAERLNIHIPEEVQIIAIEIIEDRVFDENLSPGLEARYLEIKGTIRDRLL